jgi:hypothetical protein
MRTTRVKGHQRTTKKGKPVRVRAHSRTLGKVPKSRAEYERLIGERQLSENLDQIISQDLKRIRSQKKIARQQGNTKALLRLKAKEDNLILTQRIRSGAIRID